MKFFGQNKFKIEDENMNISIWPLVAVSQGHNLRARTQYVILLYQI